MEKGNTVERSEVWNDIYEVLARLDLKEVGGDSLDRVSATTEIEQAIKRLSPAHNVKDSLPNGIDLNQLSTLLKYSDRYEISVQFWPEQTAVYIRKRGVDFQDYGGDFDFAIGASIDYLDSITGTNSRRDGVSKK